MGSKEGPDLAGREETWGTWEKAPSLPLGWKMSEKYGRTQRSKKSFNYLSSSGELFTSRKEVKRFLKKAAMRIGEEGSVWGFDSFEHDLCENIIANLGEPCEEEEDVYFVLKGKENIDKGASEGIEIRRDESESKGVSYNIKEETTSVIMSVSIDVTAMEKYEQGPKKEKKRTSVVKLGNQLLDEIEKDEELISGFLERSRSYKRRSHNERNQPYMKPLKLVKMNTSCPGCNESFMQECDLLEHLARTHVLPTVIAAVCDKAPYICPVQVCSYLQRNRNIIAQHLARCRDSSHKKFIIKIVKTKYPHYSWNNDWVISNNAPVEELESRGHYSKKEFGRMDDEGFESGDDGRFAKLTNYNQLDKLQKLSHIKNAFAEKVVRLQKLKKRHKGM